jgi:hypothetical protein
MKLNSSFFEEGKPMRRVAGLFCCALLSGLVAYGQVGNGTITGTVSDQSGAVIVGATVEARNTATGVVYTSTSSVAGNYTIIDLPVGIYTVTVDAKGFRRYTHTNLTVIAAGTLREDAALQVGTATESVTVTTESSLLKTETGELAHNVTVDQMDSLPMLGIGTVNAGTSGYRNPYNTLLTLPGVSSYTSSSTFEINGLGQAFVSTETMRTEGQDATSRLFGAYVFTQMAQPSVDAVQEIAYQTSNYAPEFGQAGSVVINMTMKSGTNQFHGTGYDYFVNEDLDAGNPFSKSGGCITGTVAGQEVCSSKGGNGGKFRPRARRNDFGGTLGGPIYIPKVYDGHNKTFFFFNYEEFLETDLYSFQDTVPTAAYLAGNFSAISPNGNCSLCAQQGIPTAALGTPVQLDPAGNQIFANEIFNPMSIAVAKSGPLAGQAYATPFPNNTIPVTMFNPIVQKILGFVPAANQPANLLTGNYTVNQNGARYSAIPAFKIDHTIDAKDKLSFYYSENTTANQFNPTLGAEDGLPNTVTAATGSFITNYQERLNYDRTLKPTLLLHIGAGLYHQSFGDNAPNITFNDNTQLGLTGNLQNRTFPTIGYPTAELGPQGTGGLQGLGPATQYPQYEMRPTGTTSISWVHGKHTYKAGAEWIYEQYYAKPYPLVGFGTTNGPTADPFTNTNSFGAFNDGFAFASFLLGDLTYTNQSVPSDTRMATMDWAFYVQDSWKVTRKLTVDYGVRWDYDTPSKEEYGRLANLNATGINTNAGGHPGNYQYAATCGCQFYKPAYPYAIGPRLGVAYQINSKTVFRGGWGVNYQVVETGGGAFTASPGTTVGTAGAFNVQSVNPNYIPSTFQFVNISTPNVIVAPNWPIVSPQYASIYPLPGSVGNAPVVPDPQQNRPSRINQWSAGFQREITRSFIMEASYVANHAVWLQPFGANLGFLSQLSPQFLGAHGLYPIPGTGPPGTNNQNARILLASPLSSVAVQQFLSSQGVTNSGLPYTGFPEAQTLAASLVPFPQYGAIGMNGAPTGDSKYDSLQMKATKRLSHGLQAGGSFTWGQGFTRQQSRQDFWNPASAVWTLQPIPPLNLNFNAIYTVPRAPFLPKWANQIAKDWQLGFFANYQSGAFLTPPSSTVNANYLPSEDIRVAGQPLYTPGVNINNLSTYNPWFTQVLNPAAWAPCPSNAVCTAPGILYKDFRGPRTPVENANIGRNFRIKERMNFQIRGEFVNVFNRTLMPGPGTSNPQAPVTKNNLGIQTGGFGVINAFFAPNTAPNPPTMSTNATLQSRQGTLIARFSF